MEFGEFLLNYRGNSGQILNFFKGLLWLKLAALKKHYLWLKLFMVEMNYWLKQLIY